MDTKYIFSKARDFGHTFLAECCQELIDWDNSGVLKQGGYMKDLSAILKPLDSDGALQLARKTIEGLAIQYVVDSKKEA